MKAVVFDIRVNSLYSIRIPYTWQSALTYPLPPPSSIIGILANALQRCENNRHPLEWLDEVEENTLWAGAKLLSPCVIKSYMTSAITKWEVNLGGKATNALGRQFAYSRSLRIVAIVKNHSFAENVKTALEIAPLTCGDSESPVSLENKVDIKNVTSVDLSEIRTQFPVPFSKEIVIREGSGSIYLLHERCKRESKSFPLRTYLLPLREEKGILYPSFITLEKPEDAVVFEVKGLGNICYFKGSREQR
jgi:CRISPR-associated Cas5-like protein